MVQRVSHSTIFVIDQDSAHDFYVNKLGFEVRMDAKMDNGFRWLTVSPKGQPDHQVVLMSLKPNPLMESFDEPTSATLRALVSNGKMIMGVLSTDDCKEGLRAFVEKRKPVWKAP